MSVEAVAALLEGSQVATRGTDLYLHVLPDTPNNVVAVNRYGGPPPVYVHDHAGPRLDPIAFQVVVRNTDVVAAEATAVAAYRCLAAVDAAVVAGVNIISIRPDQVPFPMERDDNGRFVWVCNYVMTTEV